MPKTLKTLAAAMSALLLGGCVAVTEDVYTAVSPVAVVQSAKARPAGSILVRIFKEESELEVWKLGADGRYALLKTHPMCRWSGKLGPKKTNGDRQAPEGFYQVTASLMNPNSKYHRSFNLGYPNPLERSLGYTGDSLMVHGACSSSGCFAMTDEGVSEVYASAEKAFSLGQSDFQVQAFPFRMSAAQMARHRMDPNIAFWRNLKLGYDVFEVTRREPDVAACGGRYVFDSRAADGVSPILATSACPVLASSTNPEVLAKREKDKQTIQMLLSENRAGSAMAYSDGGMNPRFRDILAKLGAKELAKETSADAVQVSRPDAALADPFKADH